MTAVVGILNKHGMALAADSAVTISGPDGTKILNRANKIFTLSKYHPVGIMIYNNATFMDVPWETIIKMYRDQLGTRSFPKLTDYQGDFLKYLRDFDGLNDVDLQKTDKVRFAKNIIHEIIESVHEDLENEDSEISDFESAILERFEFIIKTATEEIREADRLPDFQDFNIEELDSEKESILKVLQNLYKEAGKEPPPDVEAIFLEHITLLLATPAGMIDFTGLVFCGFGELEIYPQLAAVNISSMVGSRLRYIQDSKKSASVSHRHRSFIRPFAQTDVIDTLLSGIDPFLNQLYMKNFEAGIQEFIGQLSESLRPLQPGLADALLGFNYSEIKAKIAEQNMLAKRANYIQPLLGAVATLSKEDLAEMAESLIYLTYLKRRMTQQEESVGGPVDVAVISKGDGFIWIKRKHYFSPELNQFFFKNYFHENQ